MKVLGVGIAKCLQVGRLDALLAEGEAEKVREGALTRLRPVMMTMIGTMKTSTMKIGKKKKMSSGMHEKIEIPNGMPCGSYNKTLLKETINFPSLMMDLETCFLPKRNDRHSCGVAVIAATGII